MYHSHHAICSILPPHILRKLAEKPELRERALRAIETTEGFRGVRRALAILPLAVPAGTKHRTIFDARNTDKLPGAQVLDEGGALGGMSPSTRLTTIPARPTISIRTCSTGIQSTIMD